MRVTIARLLHHFGLCHMSMLGYRCLGSKRVPLGEKTALSG